MSKKNYKIFQISQAITGYCQAKITALSLRLPVIFLHNYRLILQADNDRIFIPKKYHCEKG